MSLNGEPIPKESLRLDHHPGAMSLQARLPLHPGANTLLVQSHCAGALVQQVVTGELSARPPAPESDPDAADPLRRRVAVAVACLAVLMGLAGVGGGNVSQPWSSLWCGPPILELVPVGQDPLRGLSHHAGRNGGRGRT